MDNEMQRKSTTPPTARTVSGAQMEQREILSQLHQSISELEQAISPIVRPPSDKTSAGNEVERDPRSVLDMIEAHNRVLRFAVQRLIDIGQRVEL